MNLRKLAFTKQEFAFAIGCGVTKVDELIGTGKVRAVKSGKRTIIPVEEAERYVRELPASDIKAHSNSPASKAARQAKRTAEVA